MRHHVILSALFAVALPSLLHAQAPVSFAKDIQPIFETSCWKCHGGSVQLSKLDLRTRAGALSGGVHGPALAPGNAQGSRLYRMISGAEKPAMPLGRETHGGADRSGPALD